MVPWLSEHMGQALSRGTVLSRIFLAGPALLAVAVVPGLPVVDDELVPVLLVQELVLALSLLLCWYVGTELEGSSLGRLLLLLLIYML